MGSSRDMMIASSVLYEKLFGVKVKWEKDPRPILAINRLQPLQRNLICLLLITLIQALLMKQNVNSF
jgi:hypothetical protein